MLALPRARLVLSRTSVVVSSATATLTRSKHTIGFIGLGNMGLPMAHNFVKSGCDVLCFDPNTAAVDRLVSLGARPAASVEELASAVDTVFSVLPNDDVLTSVSLGDAHVPSNSGLLANLRDGALHVSCSTIHPDTARRLDTAHRAKGVAYVAAPIFARPDGMDAMQVCFGLLLLV